MYTPAQENVFSFKTPRTHDKTETPTQLDRRKESDVQDVDQVKSIVSGAVAGAATVIAGVCMGLSTF